MDVREAFEQTDVDGNGQIDLIEFRTLLQTLGSSLDPAKAEQLFDVIDGDEDGLIGFDEFEAWYSERTG
ncbi:MAG: EF-hand domain-containing protein [Deltaproteobacteria bacterium]|nr:EF-hand domain-containing protein [Deltaproteobacteria bacterium]